MATSGTERTAESTPVSRVQRLLATAVGAMIGGVLLVRRSGMQQKLTQVTRDLVSLASGGVVALVGGLALTAAIILLLIDPIGVKPWLAALIVGGVMGLIGWMMLQKGLKDLKRTDPTPRRTVDTIKDDIQWAKEQRP